MDTLPNPEPNFSARRATTFVASIVSMLMCIFNFVTPTLHDESWTPYVRALLLVLILVSTAIAALLITLMLIM